MNSSGKRSLSITVFSLAIIFGVMCCSVMPKAIFTLGSNDSALETFALILCGFTFLPACIVAIWKRRFASIWILGLSVVWICGVIAQQLFMMSRGQPYRIIDTVGGL